VGGARLRCADSQGCTATPRDDGSRPSARRPAGQGQLQKGVVIHKGKEYRFPALPVEVLAILNDGGLIPHVKKALTRV